MSCKDGLVLLYFQSQGRLKTQTDGHPMFYTLLTPLQNNPESYIVQNLWTYTVGF